jgi:putative photosynthetic complex assembly protein 2
VGAPNRLAWHLFRGVPRMNSLWLASIAAIFLWWFSTGLILWRVRLADNGGPQAHVWSVILGLPLFGAGIWGFHTSLTDTSTAGAYIGFLSALAIWGWIELAFLSGIVTGPVTTACHKGASPLDRFARAVGTILWHEILLVATLILMAAATRDATNALGLWTFVVLFFARISAKLNLFFGVPHINTEFLPRPLAHLSSYFRVAPMNAVFPVSVTALTFAAACWMERALAAPTDAAFVGHVLLAALTLLALLEHWFMVLPLPDQKLWRWMLPDPTKTHSILKTKEPTHGL